MLKPLDEHRGAWKHLATLDSDSAASYPGVVMYNSLPGVGRLKQEDCELEASQKCIVRPENKTKRKSEAKSLLLRALAPESM